MNFEKSLTIKYDLRSLLLLLLGLIYSSYYFSRYNFPASHQILHESLGWTYSDFSRITSVALLVYGVSVVFLGSLCDRYGGKAFLKLGLIGAFIANVLFGSLYYLIESSSPLILKFGLTKDQLSLIMTVIWSFNYFCQSAGAVAIIKINAAWFSTQERANMAGKFGFYIQFGRCLVLLLCPILLAALPWSFTFYVPSILLVVMYLLSRYIQNSPEDLGYPLIGEELKHLEFKEIKKKIFSTPIILFAAILILCVSSVRAGIEHFASRFFTSEYGLMGKDLKGFFPYRLYSIFMPASMMASSLFASYICINYFNNKRFPVVLVSLAKALIWICLFILTMSNPYMAAICMIGIMFSMQMSTSTIMGMMVFDLAGRNMSASLAGIFDGIGYIGSSLISLVIGLVLDHYKGQGEWFYWPVVLLPPILIGLGISFYHRGYNPDMNKKRI